MEACKALHGLLGMVGHTDGLDAEIIDYLSSILTDPDPESSLDVLIEVIGSVVPSFSRLSEDEQTQMVLKLLDDVKSSDTPKQQPNSTPSDELHVVIAAFKDATLLSQQQSACTDITNTVRASTQSSSSSSTSGNSKEDQTGPDLSPLLELCPQGISQQFLGHMLQHKFKGDMQAAADWLLECPNMLQQQEHWQDSLREQEEQQQQAELEKQQTKKQIVERFGLEVVSSGSRKPKHGVDILPTAKKGEQEKKVRYRDGQVVSCKGEKYVIERVGEEWDGGSKGKVYTKGKRGKGFV